MNTTTRFTKGKYLPTALLSFLFLFFFSMLYVEFLAPKNEPQYSETYRLKEAEYMRFRGMNKKELKEKFAKKDRPDLAMLQDFLKTADPNTGEIPHDKIQTAHDIIEDRLAYAPEAAIAGVAWQERGPSNVGGRTRAVMYDPNDAANGYKKVWAGGVAGGLWYTDDISGTPLWVAVDNFWENIAITSLDYDPSSSTTFYAGTGEGFGNADAVRGAGIWKSTNGGATWAQIPSTAASVSTNFMRINKLIVAANGNVIVCDRNSGLQVSTNGGTTWTQKVSGNFSDAERAADGTLYAGASNSTSNKLYRSTDNGLTWTDISTPLGVGTNGRRVEIAVAPSSANTLYVIAGNGSNIAWFKKSTDAGTSWSDVAIPRYKNQDCSNSTTHFTRGQSWYDLIIAVNPTDANHILAGGVDVHRSTDGGSNWTSISYWTGGCGEYVHADIHNFKYKHGSSDEMLVTCDGGVFRSTNIKAATPNFTERNTGYNVTQFYSAAMHPSAGVDFYLAGAQDNGSHKFTAPGINPTVEVTGGDGAFCFIDQDNPCIQITSYVYNSWYKSTNGGNSFSSLGAGGNDGDFINPADYHDAMDLLYSSADATATYARWTVPAGGRTNVDVGGMTGYCTHIKASPFSPASTTTLYLGTSNGRVIRVPNAHTGTTPAGTIISNATMHSQGSISCVEFGVDENHIIVTYSNYGTQSVWYSADGGTNWTSKDSGHGLPDMPIRWALINPNNPQQVMLATEAGIWTTDDINAAPSATFWGPSNNGIAHTRCDMLQYRASDGMIAVGTHGRGLFTTDIFSPASPNFVCNNRVTYTGSNVTFTDASAKATSWSWNFGAGATPATATGAGPHTVSYATGGTKNITLVINGTITETKTAYVNVLPDLSVPYALADGGNFEANPEHFATAAKPVTPGCASAGTPTNWERGNSAVAGKNGTVSGSNAWVTGLVGNYLDSQDGALFTPNYDFSAAGCNYTLSFQLKHNFESRYDGLIVEYSTNKGTSWTKLNNAVAAGWYNNTLNADAMTFSAGFAPGQAAFTGSQTSFALKTCDVSFLAGNSNVAFRFVFATDGSVTNAGAAVDDFQIATTCPTITLTGGPGAPVCAGNTISVGFTTTGTFGAGNIFTAQLSDISGSFAAPTATASGVSPISLVIPSGLASGTYSVRVISSSPAVISNLGSVVVNALPTVTFPPLAPVCFNQPTLPLLSGTPAGGIYSGPGVSGGAFYANVAGVGTHTLMYSYTDANSCTNVAFSSITVYPLPTVTHAAVAAVCVGSSAFTVTGGSPAGGTYSGPGISGGTTFTPATAGLGTHTLIYSYTDINGCTGTVPVIITVNSGSTPVIATIPTLCPTSAPHTLSATPAGGIFSGTGVSGGVFDPAVAGIGAHIITYTYTSGGCTGTATATANVSAAGAVTFGTLTDVCLNAATYPLTTGSPAGGTYSGSGVSGGAFYANVAGAGTHTLTYTYTSGTCTGTATQTITVHALPSVSHTPSTFTTCSNSAAFTLSGGSPAGGTYTGPGVTGAVFNPASVGIGATTLLYSYTDGNGCSASVPVVIFVNAPPAPVIATIPAFCPTSAPHTLSATPAGGIFSGTGVSGGVFDPAVAGIGAHLITYTYTSGGCTGTATATANVSAAGAVTFGALTDVCLNAATYPLTTGSPAGGTYSGSGVSGGAFYANVAGAGTHTLTYTYTSGTCTGTATQTITVHALPSVSHTPSTFTTCSNSAAFTLSGGSPAGGTYTGPGVTGTVFNPASVGIGATTLLYSYTDGNGCSASVPVVIFVNAPPAPVIATIPALCLAGGTHTLSATPTGGAFSGTGISGGVFDPALAGVGMHIISYTFTSGGCTGTATRNVFVIDCSITSSPAPTVPSYLIVEGIDTETLRLRFPDSNSDEDGYEIYRSTDGVNWVLHVTTSAYTTAEIVYFDHVNTLADEKYFYIVRAVRGTKRSGFTNSAYDYTYPHAPSVTVLQAACRGGVGKFKAVGTHEGNRYRWYDRETGGEAYRGSDGNAFDGDIFTTPSISGTTTFYVTAKGKRYESKPRVAANMTVVEKANVSIIGGTDKKVCGNAVNLAVEPVSGITLQWYLNGLLISGATGNTYTATENGIYLVFADNGSCRTASAQMNVVLNYRPTALIKQGKTATFCESGTLSAKFIAGAMYSWQKDGEVFGDGIEINVSESGTYTLTVREYGCENTAEILVKVHQFPDNIALSAESTAICPGESVLLTTDIITGATYNWYKNGILFAATNDATLSVRKGGRYSVAPVLGNNCQKQSAEIILTEIKPARLTSNFDGETLTVTLPEGLNTASIQWTIDGEAAASLDNLLSFKPTKNGLYTLRIVWENGCETSMSKKIILGALGTDNGEDILSEISIYPNPANAKLFISFGKMPQNGMTTRITDNIGRVMQVGGSFESDKLILDISSLPVGLYILQIKAEGVEKSFKFVKE